MDAASSWTHSASTPRSSICAEPGTTPPRHRPDSTIPECAPRHPQFPAGFSTIPHPRAARRPSNLCHPPTARRSPLPHVQCGPPRQSCEKANPPDGPSGLRPPPDGTAATRALPASPQAQHGASRGSEDRQGQPVTTHCPSWRRPPMTTQVTTTYDERFPAVTKPTAPTGCKAHRPWTPERAATATPNGR
jgi:hypothetical protein